MAATDLDRYASDLPPTAPCPQHTPLKPAPLAPTFPLLPPPPLLLQVSFTCASLGSDAIGVARNAELVRAEPVSRPVLER